MFGKSTHNQFSVTNFPTVWGAATAALMVVLCAGVGVAQPPKSLVILNAGSGGSAIAPDSIASAFGRGIGASTESARSLPLPTTLSGVSVQITDSLKVSVLVPLLYVSPNQINFFVPATVATGTATVKILNGDSATIYYGSGGNRCPWSLYGQWSRHRRRRSNRDPTNDR